MVGFLEIGKKAFESYIKNLIFSIIFGLISTIIDILKYIPLIGIFIGALVIPRILGWYYNKTIGNIKPNYKLAFKVWSLLLFIIHIGMIAMLIILIIIGLLESELTYSTNIIITDPSIVGKIFKITIVTHLIPVFLFVFWFIFYYLLYAPLLGKISKLKITYETIERSGILFLYTFVWGILFLLIKSILLAFFAITSSAEGIVLFLIISVILSVFVEKPFLELVKAHKVLSM